MTLFKYLNATQLPLLKLKFIILDLKVMDSDIPELEDFSDVIQISKIKEKQIKLEISKSDEMVCRKIES